MTTTPGTLPLPDTPPEAMREAADAVLAGAEFRQPAPSLLERVQDGLAELVGRVLGALGDGGVVSVVAWGVVIVLLAAVVVAAVRVARTTRAGATASPVAVRPRRRATPAEWLADADRLEAAGDWRRGLRCRYRALVAELGRAGIVDDVPGRTSGEERRAAIAVLPAVAVEMGGATELFDRAWYGGLPTGPAERDRFRALSAAVVAASHEVGAPHPARP